MPVVRWGFNIRQTLLLEHIQPLVTSLIASGGPNNIVPMTNLLSFLPKIESDRLLRFRIDDDMRRALIGRLMIHAFFVAHHGCSWVNLVFSRSEANKPILVRTLNPSLFPSQPVGFIGPFGSDASGHSGAG